MGFKTVFCVVLLVFKNVLCYCARDSYIFAYIPIEEFAYLTQSEIEIPALSSSSMMYTNGFDIGSALYIDDLISSYCNGMYNTGNRPGYTVYSPPASVSYQPTGIPSITLLPPVALPTPSVLTNPSLAISSPSLAISSPILPISSPSLATSSPSLQLLGSSLPLPETSLHVDHYDFEESIDKIDYYSGSNLATPYTIGSSLPVSSPIYTPGSSPVYSSVTAPYYGSRTFRGMVPASGSVKIYGSSY